MIAWQDPPPYVQYMAEAETLGRASYLAGVCTSIGMIETDQQALRDMADDMYRRATNDHAEGPILLSSFEAGSAREAEAVNTMLDLGPDDGSERRARREEQAAEYLGTGCADLTINYPDVFRWIAD